MDDLLHAAHANDVSLLSLGLHVHGPNKIGGGAWANRIVDQIITSASF